MQRPKNRRQGPRTATNRSFAGRQVRVIGQLLIDNEHKLLRIDLRVSPSKLPNVLSSIRTGPYWGPITQTAVGPFAIVLISLGTDHRPGPIFATRARTALECKTRTVDDIERMQNSPRSIKLHSVPQAGCILLKRSTLKNSRLLLDGNRLGHSGSHDCFQYLTDRSPAQTTGDLIRKARRA